MKLKPFMVAAGLAVASSIALSGAAHAAGGNVLVEDVGNTWGFDESANMTDVFGANFSEMNYSGLDATSLFSAGNNFVMLEGGDGSTQELADFLAANTSTVTNWVSNGGHLLLRYHRDGHPGRFDARRQTHRGQPGLHGANGHLYQDSLARPSVGELGPEQPAFERCRPDDVARRRSDGCQRRVHRIGHIRDHQHVPVHGAELPG